MSITTDESEARRILADDQIVQATHPDLVPSDQELRSIAAELQAAYDLYTCTVSVRGHAASLQVASYLLFLCRRLNARRVCDLGSGFSSYVLDLWAREAAHPVTVMSVDTDPDWMNKTVRFITDHGGGDGHDFCSWDYFQTADVGLFDLIFHDLAGGDVRTDAMPTVVAHVAPFGVAIFDDMHHDGHRAGAESAAAEAGLASFCLVRQTFDDCGRFAMLATERPPAYLGAEYAQVCAEPSDIYLHLPRLVKMVEALNAQHVIELGTRTGVSTIAWLHALARTGGRLTSVDLDVRPPIGEHAHWTFIQGDDMDPAISSSLDVADIVFIDTSHHYTHTLRELHTYRWLVKPGGLIVCHDTELPRPEGMPPSDPVFPVKKAIERFVAEAGLVWSNVSECWGLGIIEVV
jgi:predicted O-methyltransferase YrrM